VAPSLLEWRTLVFVIPVAFAVLLVLAAALGVIRMEAAPAAGPARGVLPALGGLPLPLSLMLVSFMFGGIGLVAGPLVRAVIPGPPMAGGLVAVAVALASAVVVSGRLARVVGRKAALYADERAGKDELVGTGGKLVVAASADRRGLAWVRDRRGRLHQVTCHTEEGEPDLPSGTDVLVVHYDDRANLFLVTADPLA
jgi:hypothetical protein